MSAANWARRRLFGRPGSFHLVLSFFSWTPNFNLGLACLAAFAKARIPGIRVTLLAATPSMSPDQFTDSVVGLKPDLVGVSAMTPTWAPLAERLTRLRQAAPEIRVVVGGYQATLAPDETIAHPAVDFACVGEGEIPLARLIARLQGVGPGDEPTPGLWEKLESGQIRRAGMVLTPDLSRDSLPDYSIFEHTNGLRAWGQQAVEPSAFLKLPVLTGRGCPHRCSYCNNTTLLDIHKGRLLRKYEPEMLIDELARLRGRCGVEFFQFWDEMFLYDLRYTRRFLGDYERHVQTPFSIFAHVEKMDASLCELATRAGCHSMWFGVESGSEEYRRRYLNRHMTNHQILTASDNARRAGIKLMSFAMVGMPFETRADLLATLELTKQINPERAVFAQYLPLPGTPLYRLAAEAGLLLKKEDEGQMWELGRLNIKESAGAATGEDLREIVAMIVDYHAKNNRLDA